MANLTAHLHFHWSTNTIKLKRGSEGLSTVRRFEGGKAMVLNGKVTQHIIGRITLQYNPWAGQNLYVFY